MSAPLPIHINELNEATVLNDNDVFVINQGTADRQIKASLVKAIQWASFPSTATLNPSDLVLINQAGTTSKVQASKFFMPVGTRMWFYQTSAPTGWTIKNYAGDALLAVYTSGAGTYNSTTLGTEVPVGTWQLPDHTLTINEIPAHTHQLNSSLARASSPGNDLPAVMGVTNTQKTTTTSVGSGQPHNHGSTWRPKAYVGFIAQKN